MGVIGARCEDKVHDQSRCKKSVIPLLHSCCAKGKSFLWENSLDLIETRAAPCRVGPVASGGEDTGVMTDWLGASRMRQEAEEPKSAEPRSYQPSLDLRQSEWSRDFKGLGCQLPAWRPQEEGAEKQAVWLVLVSEDTSFWHQVPSYVLFLY